MFSWAFCRIYYLAMLHSVHFSVINRLQEIVDVLNSTRICIFIMYVRRFLRNYANDSCNFFLFKAVKLRGGNWGTNDFTM